MNKKIIYLLGIFITIILGSFLYWKFCCCKKEIKKNEKIPKKVEVVVDKQPTLSFGTYNANGTIGIPLNDGVKFNKSSINFSSPISGELNSKIGKLKDFLAKENEKSLSITGYYTSDEVNNSIFPNIGMARAISFKNYVAGQGIPTKIIDIEGKLDDNMIVDENNVMKTPLKLSVGKSKDYSKLINSIIKEIESNPLLLNFNSGKTTLNFSHNQRRKIVNISTYLDKVDNSFCLITGHTDNTGSASRNLVIGKQRAEFIKEYFTRSGIIKTRINTVSKGETTPIATNATKEGRAKNRRSIVTIN
ncbi:OmpA family protein [Tenacibaculum pacificus]|uniref:OmpA family protein n=1 Tax=Tenacibaculum pacificus TaxID=3018314 RepID=UPI0022F38426|nr:OmpA family protein [Tenacibaculum pacificus]WBX73672.1 OmpA family protein [Tenacibaculum pacificus]